MSQKEMPQEYLVSIRSVLRGDGRMKLVLRTRGNARFSRLLLGGKEYAEKYNDIEPFDLRYHVFEIPQSEVARAVPFSLAFRNYQKKSPYFEQIGEEGILHGVYDPAAAEEYDACLATSDSHITVTHQEEIAVAAGVRSVVYDATDKNGAPMKMFALFVDPKKVSVMVGTPDNGYLAGECSQTVMGELEAAVRDGYRVIAATNADFFDIHGNCMPAGLVVKNGRVVANADSTRPFFGIKKDGTVVITSQELSLGILPELAQAVCGRDLLLKDGVPCEPGLFESFGDMRHPRTCVGRLADGSFVILVVDGRLPEYSNGATLWDLVRLMQHFGAVDALNLDGGGSSTMIIRTENGYTMLNHPADLVHPQDNLIRDVYNSILMIEKD